MKITSTTDTENKFEELLELANTEAVFIERNGVPRYQIISTDSHVAVPVDEYQRLKSVKRVPVHGFAKEQLKGLDSAALLAVDISAEFGEAW